MDEKRRAKRLKEDNEVIITIDPGGGKYHKEKVIYNQSKDISVSGAKIQTNMFLPVDTLLRMNFIFKNQHPMINVVGKVKWIKNIFEDEFFEAGVEFIYTSSNEILKLSDYTSKKQETSVVSQK